MHLLVVFLFTLLPFFVQLEVWAKEREVTGLRASLNTLMSEIQRLNKLCAERKEAEDSLRKKWKKIEEFDSRRSELEIIYSALLKANMVRCNRLLPALRCLNFKWFLRQFQCSFRMLLRSGISSH